MSKPKAYPYPQIVTGDEWHVLEPTESDPTPRTDNLNRQMYVPMDRECERCGINHSRLVRRHELGHAKWSPKTIGKLSNGTRSDAIEALEEVRINYRLGKSKLPIDNYIMCEDYIDLTTNDMIMHNSIADIILYLLSTYSYMPQYNEYRGKTYEKVLSAFRSAINGNDITTLRKAEIQFAINTAKNFMAQMERHKWNQLPSYRKTQKLAEKLSIILNAFIDKPKPEDVIAKPQAQQAGGATEEGNSEDATEQFDGSVEALEQRMRKELMEDMMYHSSDGIGYWGEMEIHNPPLPVNLQARLKNARAYRPADYGYNPKYINRYCIDKKIFKQKQRVKGGTILIDASGSMAFSGSDLLEIMKILPAVNIAMYNGRFSRKGDLRIIAKNGMRVSDDYLVKYTGGGNLVDGPALRWLATMPARRIWVSDMKVFGATGNTSGFNLLKECYDICTSNKIINLKDIDEVKEYALKLNEVL